MFDDDYLLMANKDFFIEDGSLSKIFTTDAYMRNDMTFYRPLQNLSFLFDVKLSGGMNMWMFHCTNILLFSLIASSLYFLLLKIKISSFYAFLGIIIYAANPLFASSAAWIPARGDLMLTLFSILCFIFWIRFIKEKNYGALILTWLCFTLALFTKETAAFLPVLFFIYFFVFNTKPKIDFKIVMLGLLFLCTAIAWYFLRALSIVDSNSSITIFEFSRNLLAIPASLAMFIVPYDFSTVPEFTLLKAILGSTFLFLLILLTFIKTSQPRKIKIFFFLWFLLLLFPTFFANSKEVDYLDHRFLLPLIGIFIFILLHIPEKYKTKITSFSIIIIIIFSVVTIFRTQVFANPIAFYEAAKLNKNKPEVYYFLKGNIEMLSDKFDKALKSYNTVIEYNPDHIRALNNRGIIKQTMGDFEGALADFNRAIELELINFHIFKNRGIVKMNLHDYAGAIEDFGFALEFEHHAEIYYHRGNAYLILEKIENAWKDFIQYSSESNINPEIFTNLGINFGQKGNIEKSIDCFSRAIDAEPTYTHAFYNRAFAKYISADYEAALADCEKLLALDPMYKNALILAEQCKKNFLNQINKRKND
jgi:lipoprotein NlpI